MTDIELIEKKFANREIKEIKPIDVGGKTRYSVISVLPSGEVAHTVVMIQGDFVIIAPT